MVLYFLSTNLNQTLSLQPLLKNSFPFSLLEDNKFIITIEGPYIVHVYFKTKCLTYMSRGETLKMLLRRKASPSEKVKMENAQILTF